MGQSIVVTEKPSSVPGVVRFETNRALTGMGHERYRAGDEVWGNRPPDELARRLLGSPAVAGVQVNSNVITVDLAKGFGADGIKETIENLYRFYPDAPPAAGAEADAEAETPAETPAEVPAETPAAVPTGAEATAPVGGEAIGEVDVPAESPAEAEADVPAEPVDEVDAPVEVDAAEPAPAAEG